MNIETYWMSYFNDKHVLHSSHVIFLGYRMMDVPKGSH